MNLYLGRINLHRQVKIEVSHHLLENGDLKSIKPLVFVVEEPPALNQDVKQEDGKKRRKKKHVPPAPTSKNFGGYLKIPKVKTSEILVVCWRCRFLATI